MYIVMGGVMYIVMGLRGVMYIVGGVGGVVYIVMGDVMYFVIIKSLTPSAPWR